MRDQIDSEVREAIATEMQAELSACDGLRKFARSMLSPWGGRSIDPPHEQLLVAIFSRALSTYSGAVELARMGYGPQAAMLNRSLFEDMIDAHWVTVEPELSARLVEDHHQHTRMLNSDLLRDLKLAPEDEIPTFTSGQRKLLTDLFGKHGGQSWTRLSIYERARAVEHLWRDEEGGREALHFYRRAGHAEANRILHLSAHSMLMQIRSRSADELVLSSGPSNYYVRRALLGGFYVFGQLVSLIRDTFEFGGEDQWRNVYDRVFDKPPDLDAI